MVKFPKTVYLKQETDGDDTFFIVDTDVNGHAAIGQTIEVGKYELVKPIKLMTITKEMTDG